MSAMSTNYRSQYDCHWQFELCSLTSFTMKKLKNIVVLIIPRISTQSRKCITLDLSAWHVRASTGTRIWTLHCLVAPQRHRALGPRFLRDFQLYDLGYRMCCHHGLVFTKIFLSKLFSNCQNYFDFFKIFDFYNFKNPKY
jgi:hypothetical protein